MEDSIYLLRFWGRYDLEIKPEGSSTYGVKRKVKSNRKIFDTDTQECGLTLHIHDLRARQTVIKL